MSGSHLERINNGRSRKGRPDFSAEEIRLAVDRFALFEELPEEPSLIRFILFYTVRCGRMFLYETMSEGTKKALDPVGWKAGHGMDISRIFCEVRKRKPRKNSGRKIRATPVFFDPLPEEKSAIDKSGYQR